jgi:alginate O-acetyltransferase complex protein AlgI
MPLHRRPEVQCIGLLLALLAIGETSLYARYSPKLAATIASMQKSTLNVSDAAILHKGYYENLDNSSRMTAQLWDIRAKKPSHWVSLSGTEAYRKRTDFMLADLRPDVHTSFEDQAFTTNRCGMRDRDRSLAKPEGTYRIALLGPSHIMGFGVADDQMVAIYLEERLNRNAGPGPHQRYEVLNFGVAAYSLIQQLAMLEDRVVGFIHTTYLVGLHRCGLLFSRGHCIRAWFARRYADTPSRRAG